MSSATAATQVWFGTRCAKLPEALQVVRVSYKILLALPGALYVSYVSIRDVCQKTRETVGIFPKSGTPQFGNPMFVRRKKIGLFCILGQFGTFLVFTKMLLSGWYYG